MASLHIQPSFLWSAGVLWPAVCTAIVTVRFVTRRVLGGHYGWDDWLILPAWALTCALSALLLVGVAEKAMGYPTPVIAPDLTLIATSREQTVTRKIFWVMLLLHTPALTLIKLSCVAFYSRAFRTGHSTQTKILIGILVAVVTGWGITFTITTLFTCGTHFNYLWTSLENQLKCTINTSMWQKGMAFSDVLMDLCLLIFPLPYIWQLKMKTGRKLGLGVIFLFGSLSIVASTMRLVILLQALDVEFRTHIDQDYLSTAAAYFMLLEAGFGIIAICLPTVAGTLRLEGVQTFFANVSQVLSLRSISIRSASPSQKDSDDDCWKSDEDFSLHKQSDTHTHVVALKSFRADRDKQGGVHVTKTVELMNYEV